MAHHLSTSVVVQAWPAGLAGYDHIVNVSIEADAGVIGQYFVIAICDISSDQCLIQASTSGHAANTVGDLVPYSPTQPHKSGTFPVVDGQLGKGSRPTMADEPDVQLVQVERLVEFVSVPLEGTCEDLHLLAGLTANRLRVHGSDGSPALAISPIISAHGIAIEEPPHFGLSGTLPEAGKPGLP